MKPVPQVNCEEQILQQPTVATIQESTKMSRSGRKSAPSVKRLQCEISHLQKLLSDVTDGDLSVLKNFQKMRRRLFDTQKRLNDEKENMDRLTMENQFLRKRCFYFENETVDGTDTLLDGNTQTGYSYETDNAMVLSRNGNKKLGEDNEELEKDVLVLKNALDEKRADIVKKDSKIKGLECELIDASSAFIKLEKSREMMKEDYDKLIIKLVQENKAKEIEHETNEGGILDLIAQDMLFMGDRDFSDLLKEFKTKQNLCDDDKSLENLEMIVSLSERTTKKSSDALMRKIEEKEKEILLIRESKKKAETRMKVMEYNEEKLVREVEEKEKKFRARAESAKRESAMAVKDVEQNFIVQIYAEREAKGKAMKEMIRKVNTLKCSELKVVKEMYAEREEKDVAIKRMERKIEDLHDEICAEREEKKKIEVSMRGYKEREEEMRSEINLIKTKAMQLFKDCKDENKSPSEELNKYRRHSYGHPNEREHPENQPSAEETFGIPQLQSNEVMTPRGTKQVSFDLEQLVRPKSDIKVQYPERGSFLERSSNNLRITTSGVLGPSTLCPRKSPLYRAQKRLELLQGDQENDLSASNYNIGFIDDDNKLSAEIERPWTPYFQNGL